MLAVICHFALGCCATHAHASGEAACAEHGHTHQCDHDDASPRWPVEPGSLPVESPTTCTHNLGCSAIVRVRAETEIAAEQAAAFPQAISNFPKPCHLSRVLSVDGACPLTPCLPFYLSGERLLI